MGSSDNQAGHPQNPDDQLARDVSHLYAWANVDNAPYRDFFRQRKLRRQESSSLAAEIPNAKAVDKETSSMPEPVTAPRRIVLEETTTGTAIEPRLVSEAVDKPPITMPSAEVRSEPITYPPEVPPSFETSSVFAVDTPETTQVSGPIENAASHPGENQPVMAIYSLAGGVGKTTLCANLGRVFCFQGERVLLVDASGSGLLPFYFGADDLHPGLRTFVEPDRRHLPLQVICTDEVTPEWLESDVKEAMRTVERTIIDFGPASFHLAPRILEMCTDLLIPLLPNPNSILSIRCIENSLQKIRSAGGSVPFPYYVFNEFDEEHPRDVKSRELVSRQYGNRLLNLSIRYGMEVEEAIASRMTVTDHAPASEVALDYQNLAVWLKKLAPVAPERSVARRWTEQ